MKKKRSNLASLLGRSYAYVQHSLDIATSWAFEKLSSVSSSAKKESEHPVTKALKNLGTFVGEAGSSFYDEYERLKEKRRQK